MRFIAFLTWKRPELSPVWIKLWKSGPCASSTARLKRFFQRWSDPLRSIPPGAQCGQRHLRRHGAGQAENRETLLGPLTRILRERCFGGAHNAAFDYGFLTADYYTCALRFLRRRAWFWIHIRWPKKFFRVWRITNCRHAGATSAISTPAASTAPKATPPIAVKFLLKMVERITGSPKTWPPLANLMAF